jgi:hypothetical protein
MTELEKLSARIVAVDEAIKACQHAVTVERKMSHDKHTNGHLTKALTELTGMKASLEAVYKRVETIGR